MRFWSRSLHRLRNAKGNLSLLTALSIVPLSVLVGCVIDYARLSDAWTQAQQVADAAALAIVASDIAMNGSGDTDPVSARLQIAQAMVDANIAARYKSHVSIPAITGPDAKGAVTVAVRIEIPTQFLKIAGISVLEAAVSATAMPGAGGHACVVALDATGDGIALGGNSATDLGSCWLYSNAAGSNSINISGSATVKAAGACASGTVSASDPSAINFTPRNGCKPTADPLADQKWPEPTLPCKDKNYADSGSKSDKTRTYHAGTHCDISASGNIQHVVFDPGIHIVAGNSFNVSAGTVDGNGVGIFLETSVTSFDLQAQTKMTLSAMSSGDMAGIVIAQRPGGKIHKDTFNGGSDLILNGTVYLPNSTVTLDGNNSTSISPVSVFIASSIILKGTASLRFSDDFDAAGFPEMSAFASDVRLID